MLEKPEWIKQLEAKPCQCKPCSICNGNGNIRLDSITGRPTAFVDDLYDLEPCDQCWGGGLAEKCERCQQLDDWDADQEQSSYRVEACR